MICTVYYFNVTYKHEKEVSNIKINIYFFYKRIFLKICVLFKLEITNVINFTIIIIELFCLPFKNIGRNTYLK